MPIEAARLASGSVTVNGISSANKTVIAQIFTVNEPDIKAVVKCLTPKQIANELIAAALTQSLNLPSPRPFLVFADPEDAISGDTHKHSSGKLIYFGSEISSGQPIIHFFNMNDYLAFEMINKYDKWGNLLAFDEWTANVDRHLKNYLYDGTTIMLFDHDQCLTGWDWTPAKFNPSKSYPCHSRIDEIHQHMPKDKKIAAARLSKKLQQLASELDLDKIIDMSLAAETENDVPDDLPSAVKFLNARKSCITDLCVIRLA